MKNEILKPLKHVQVAQHEKKKKMNKKMKLQIKKDCEKSDNLLQRGEIQLSKLVISSFERTSSD